MDMLTFIRSEIDNDLLVNLIQEYEEYEEKKFLKEDSKLIELYKKYANTDDLIGLKFFGLTCYRELSYRYDNILRKVLSHLGAGGYDDVTYLISPKSAEDKLYRSINDTLKKYHSEIKKVNWLLDNYVKINEIELIDGRKMYKFNTGLSYSYTKREAVDKAMKNENINTDQEEWNVSVNI